MQARFTVTLCLTAALLCGCLTPGERKEYNKDVSNSAGWAGFDRDRIYQTKVPLFLEPGDYDDNPQLALEKGASFPRYYGAPRASASAEAYKANPSQWPDVIGLLEPGTRIRAADLREPGVKIGWLRIFYLGQPLFRYVRGEILDGPHAGTIASMEAVSLYNLDARTSYPPGGYGDVLEGPNLECIALVDN